VTPAGGLAKSSSHATPPPPAAFGKCSIGYSLLEVHRAIGLEASPLRDIALAALSGSERCARFHNVQRTAQLTPTP
jgi:hypothetical protein